MRNIVFKIYNSFETILTSLVALSAFGYFYQVNSFNSLTQKWISIVFYCAYIGHFFLIFRSFKELSDKSTNVAKEFGPRKWLNCKLEIFIRFLIIIVAIFVSGLGTTIIIELWNQTIGIFYPTKHIECLDTRKTFQNFTIFALILTILVLIWNALAIFFDYIIDKNYSKLKEDLFQLNWPEHSKVNRAKNSQIFNLLPPRLRYFIGDIIALIFWVCFNYAVFYSNDYHFVDVISIFIVVYIILILYRALSIKYKYE